MSACHGLHPSPDYPQGDPDGPGCYTSLVKTWVEKTFPGVSGCEQGMKISLMGSAGRS